MMFKSKKKRKSPLQEPLEYHIEPVNMDDMGNKGYASEQLGYSRTSLHRLVPPETIPSTYAPSSDGYTIPHVATYPPVPNDIPSTTEPRAPLRLRNNDDIDEHRPEAPPLPRKITLTTDSGTGSKSTVSPSEAGTSDTAELRGELENLRREIEEMRSRTGYEPPPQYH
ncbi:hypothetical protein EV361DRAFT_456912 [Lentinula raphanica]|nr:hypothetical protein EV361DRAFT_456912 [Lentinula raphanica]